MSSRKQTPDVLGDILGGEPAAVPPTADPKPAPPRPATKRQRRPRKPKQVRWEYMEVVFRDYGSYRPRCVNGEEQAGWKDAPAIQEYLNQVGEEGWELVAMGGRHGEEMPAYFKRVRSD